MAKKIDPSSLTVDYKQLMRMPLSQRLEIANSGFADDVLRDITPTQLAQAFPRYYQRAMPDIGKIVSAGGSGTLPAATAIPSPKSSTPSTPSTPSGRQNPQQSQQSQRNALLDALEEATGKKTQYTTSGSGVDRSRFKKELENDPQLAQRIMSLAKAEVGNQGPSAQQKWMETIFNRAYAQGRSLSQVIDPNNGYWPKGQKRPQLSKAEIDAYQATLGKVVAGSNESNYATDNASAGLAKKREQSGRVGTWDNGEFFYIDNHYRKAMERLRAETEQRARDQATKPLKPDQERPSQSGAVTGLTPESSIPGKTSDPNKVTKDNSKQIIAQAAKGDKTIGDRILDRALQLEGMNEIDNRRTIQKYLKNGGKGVDPAVTPWCADFINSTLAQEGIKGTGSEVATSFSKWGISVDPSKVRKGDVLVEHRNRAPGEPGGHVSFATGQTRINPRTGRLEIEYYGGNQGVPGRGPIEANKKWIDASKLYVRRAPEAQEEMISGNIQSRDTKTKEDLKYPNDYNSWDPKLKQYIESLSPELQQKIFDKNEELVSQNKGHINDLFAKLVEKNPDLFAVAPKAIVDSVKNAPPGEAPRLDQELSYGFWKEGSVPTPEERKKVFEKGGVVVNLDTNWAKRGVQTGPLVVIPDNATDEQRKQAQIYVRQIEEAYKEKFGKSLPGKVLTRSENKRGRESTMHTEPFSVNDEKAVEYFTRTPEGRAKLADITSNTIGKIPGVQFSLPHDPYKPQRPDYGSVGPLGSEVDIASVLKRDLEEKQRVQREQIQSKQIAPVVAEPTAVPVSSDQYNANATNAQQPSAPSSQADQKAGVAPLTSSQPSSVSTQPQASQVQEQKMPDTGTTTPVKQNMPDNGTTVANPVPMSTPETPASPEKQMAYGDTGRLPPTGREPIQLVNKGKVLADVSPGEMIKAPSFGTNKPEVIPETRIRDIRAEQQNNPQTMDQPEQPMQQPQNVAGMTSGATQMPPPNMYNDTNKVYQPYMESAGKIDTVANAKAYAYSGFKELISDNHSSGVNRMNTGFNTLTA